MNSILLLVERGSTWTPITWVEGMGGRHVGNGRVLLEREVEWLSVVRDDDVLNDFDEAERKRVDELVGEHVAFVLEWKGGGLIEQLLRSVPPGIRAAIDNDHGLLTSVMDVANEPLNSWVRAASRR